jgi:hypothetical protein
MKKLSLILILTILVSLLSAKIYLLSKNTLLNNGQWDSGKLNLDLHVIGAENFYTETQPLNNERLNLGAWLGYQEVYTKNPLTFNQIEFDAFLSQNSYLISYFNINDKNKIGFKISSDKKNNGCIKADHNGKFLTDLENKEIEVKTAEWFHVTVKIENGEANIFIDDQKIVCSTEGSENIRIGFKNGFSDVLIDNIVIKHNYITIFKETFSNSKNLLRLASIGFVLSTIIQFLVTN